MKWDASRKQFIVNEQKARHFIVPTGLEETLLKPYVYQGADDKPPEYTPPPTADDYLKLMEAKWDNEVCQKTFKENIKDLDKIGVKHSKLTKFGY
jgi:hypothetical protein